MLKDAIFGMVSIHLRSSRYQKTYLKYLMRATHMPRNTGATTKSLLVDFDKTIIYPHTFQNLCSIDDKQAYQMFLIS